MEKFLHMTDLFSTSTAGGAGDKYQVCSKAVFTMSEKESISVKETSISLCISPDFLVTEEKDEQRILGLHMIESNR